MDSDVEARLGAPDIRSLERPGKDVYLALGESRRVNSGVILVRNTSEARALFSKILASATQPVPAEDEVTSWGENGHAIHFTKSYPGLELIGREWNNTAGPMTDHFRHYTGSMKAHFHRSLTGRLSVRFGRVMAKSGVLKEPGPDFHLDVEDLAARAFAPHRDVLACRALYPLPRHRAGTLTQDLGTR